MSPRIDSSLPDSHLNAAKLERNDQLVQERLRKESGSSSFQASSSGSTTNLAPSKPQQHAHPQRVRDSDTSSMASHESIGAARSSSASILNAEVSLTSDVDTSSIPELGRNTISGDREQPSWFKRNWHELAVGVATTLAAVAGGIVAAFQAASGAAAAAIANAKATMSVGQLTGHMSGTLAQKIAAMKSTLAGIGSKASATAGVKVAAVTTAIFAPLVIGVVHAVSNFKKWTSEGLSKVKAGLRALIENIGPAALATGAAVTVAILAGGPIGFLAVALGIGLYFAFNYVAKKYLVPDSLRTKKELSEKSRKPKEQEEETLAAAAAAAAGGDGVEGTPSTAKYDEQNTPLESDNIKYVAIGEYDNELSRAISGTGQPSNGATAAAEASAAAAGGDGVEGTPSTAIPQQTASAAASAATRTSPTTASLPNSGNKPQEEEQEQQQPSAAAADQGHHPAVAQGAATSASTAKEQQEEDDETFSNGSSSSESLASSNRKPKEQQQPALYTSAAGEDRDGDSETENDGNFSSRSSSSGSLFSSGSNDSTRLQSSANQRPGASASKTEVIGETMVSDISRKPKNPKLNTSGTTGQPSNGATAAAQASAAAGGGGEGSPEAVDDETPPKGSSSSVNLNQTPNQPPSGEPQAEDKEFEARKVIQSEEEKSLQAIREQGALIAQRIQQEQAEKPIRDALNEAQRLTDLIKDPAVKEQMIAKRANALDEHTLEAAQGILKEAQQALQVQDERAKGAIKDAERLEFLKRSLLQNEEMLTSLNFGQFIQSLQSQIELEKEHKEALKEIFAKHESEIRLQKTADALQEAGEYLANFAAAMIQRAYKSWKAKKEKEAKTFFDGMKIITPSDRIAENRKRQAIEKLGERLADRAATLSYHPNKKGNSTLSAEELQKKQDEARKEALNQIKKNPGKLIDSLYNEALPENAQKPDASLPLEQQLAHALLDCERYLLELDQAPNTLFERLLRAFEKNPEISPGGPSVTPAAKEKKAPVTPESALLAHAAPEGKSPPAPASKKLLQQRDLIHEETNRRVKLIQEESNSWLQMALVQESELREKLEKQLFDNMSSSVQKYRTELEELAGRENAERAAADMADKLRRTMTEQTSLMLTEETERAENAQKSQKLIEKLLSDFTEGSSKLAAQQAVAKKQVEARDNLIAEQVEEFGKAASGFYKQIGQTLLNEQVRQLTSDYEQTLRQSIEEIESQARASAEKQASEWKASAEQQETGRKFREADSQLENEGEKSSPKLTIETARVPGRRTLDAIKTAPIGLPSEPQSNKEAIELVQKNVEIQSEEARAYAEMISEEQRMFKQVSLVAQESMKRAKTLEEAKMFFEMVQRLSVKLAQVAGRETMMSEEESASVAKDKAYKDLLNKHQQFIEQSEDKVRDALSQQEAREFAEFAKNNLEKNFEPGLRAGFEQAEKKSFESIQKEHQRLMQNMKQVQELFTQEINERQNLGQTELTERMQISDIEGWRSELKRIAEAVSDEYLSQQEQQVKSGYIEEDKKIKNKQEFENSKKKWEILKNGVYNSAKNAAKTSKETSVHKKELADEASEEFSKLRSELNALQGTSALSKTAYDLLGTREQSAKASAATAAASGGGTADFKVAEEEKIRGLSDKVQNAKNKYADLAKALNDEKEKFKQAFNKAKEIRSAFSVSDSELDDLSLDEIEEGEGEDHLNTEGTDDQLLPYLKAGTKLPAELIGIAKEQVQDYVREYDIAGETKESNKKPYHENKAILAAKLVFLILKAEPANPEFQGYAKNLLKRYLSTIGRAMRADEGPSISRRIGFATAGGSEGKKITRFTKIQLATAMLDLASRDKQTVQDGLKTLFAGRKNIDDHAWKEKWVPPVSAIPIKINFKPFEGELPKTAPELEKAWKQSAPEALDLKTLTEMAASGSLDARYFLRFEDQAVNVLLDYVYPHWLMTRPENKNYPGERATAENVLDILPHTTDPKEKINLMVRTMATCSKKMAEGGLGNNPLSRDQCRILADMRTGGYFHLKAGGGKSKAVSLYPAIMGSDRTVLHVSPFKIENRNPGVETITIRELRNRLSEDFSKYVLVFDEYDSAQYLDPEPVLQEALSKNSIFQMSATQNVDDIHSIAIRNGHKLDLLLNRTPGLDASTRKSLEAYRDKANTGQATQENYEQVVKLLDELSAKKTQANVDRIDEASDDEEENALHSQVPLNFYIDRIKKALEQIQQVSLDKQKVWAERLSDQTLNRTAETQEAVIDQAIERAKKLGGEKKSLLVGFPEERDVKALVNRFKQKLGSPEENTSLLYLDGTTGAEICEVWNGSTWETKTPQEFDAFAKKKNPLTYCLYTDNMRGGDFRTHSKERAAEIMIHYPASIPPEDELCQHIWRDRSRQGKVTLFTTAQDSLSIIQKQSKERQKKYNTISIRVRMRNKAAQAMRQSFETALQQTLPDGYQVNTEAGWEAEFKRAQKALPGSEKELTPEEIQKREDAKFLNRLNLKGIHVVIPAEAKGIMGVVSANKLTSTTALSDLTIRPHGQSQTARGVSTPRTARGSSLQPIDDYFRDLNREELEQLAELLKRNEAVGTQISKMLEYMRNKATFQDMMARAKNKFSEAMKEAGRMDISIPEQPERFSYYMRALRELNGEERSRTPTQMAIPTLKLSSSAATAAASGGSSASTAAASSQGAPVTFVRTETAPTVTGPDNKRVTNANILSKNPFTRTQTSVPQQQQNQKSKIKQK